VTGRARTQTARSQNPSKKTDGGISLPFQLKGAASGQQHRRNCDEPVYLSSVTHHMQKATGSSRFANGPGDVDGV
jgi:hypothetical protein